MQSFIVARQARGMTYRVLRAPTRGYGGDEFSAGHQCRDFLFAQARSMTYRLLREHTMTRPHLLRVSYGNTPSSLLRRHVL